MTETSSLTWKYRLKHKKILCHLRSRLQRLVKTQWRQFASKLSRTIHFCCGWVSTSNDCFYLGFSSTKTNHRNKNKQRTFTGWCRQSLRSMSLFNGSYKKQPLLNINYLFILSRVLTSIYRCFLSKSWGFTNSCACLRIIFFG